MATLAFGFIAEITVQRWTDLTGGTMGVLGIPSLDFGSRKMGAAYFMWIAGAVYLTVQILSDYLFSSRYYRVLLAIKENESAAQTAGLNVPVWRTAVFALSAVAAGIAGVFLRIRTPTSTATPSHEPDAELAGCDRHRRLGHPMVR